MQTLRIRLIVVVLVATFCAVNSAFGQGVRQNIPQTGLGAPGGTGTVQVTPLTPVQPLTVAPSPGGTQFDPYGSVPGAANTPPALYGQPGAIGQPASVAPQLGGTVPPYGGGVLGTPQAAPYGAYPPQNPGSLFPSATWPQGGLFNNWNGTTIGTGLGAGVAASAAPLRFIYGPRIQSAWLAGGNASNDLGIIDTDVSVVVTWPNFFVSTQPLYILPSFSLHLWDGPKNLATSDLPSRAYSAFIDLGWNSDPNRPIGAELGGRIGVFTGFNTFTTNSGRLLGKALLTSRVTPEIQIKAGVMYVDRIGVKLIPAGGILWTPNPDTRFDVFFPKPQLAQRVTTFGNNDLWWYFGGEYGGGSWTVERTSGASDQVDINDIRLYLGLEWGPAALIRAGRRVAFFEAGWVFDRELRYRSGVGNLDLKDTFMLRAGLGY